MLFAIAFIKIRKFALGLKPPSQSIRIIPPSPAGGLCVTVTRQETAKNTAQVSPELARLSSMPVSRCYYMVIRLGPTDYESQGRVLTGF